MSPCYFINIFLKHVYNIYVEKVNEAISSKKSIKAGLTIIKNSIIRYIDKIYYINVIKKHNH